MHTFDVRTYVHICLHMHTHTQRFAAQQKEVQVSFLCREQVARTHNQSEKKVLIPNVEPFCLLKNAFCSDWDGAFSQVHEHPMSSPIAILVIRICSQQTPSQFTWHGADHKHTLKLLESACPQGHKLVTLAWIPGVQLFPNQQTALPPGALKTSC